MTDKIKYSSPPCPMCAAATTLKEVQRETRSPGFMAFFQCGSCATIYPRAMTAGEAGALRSAGPLD